MLSSDLLVQRIRVDLGADEKSWIAPRGYDSVALAVIDSIFSIGTHYSGVVNALNRYRKARCDEGATPNLDSATDLADAVRRWGVEGLVERTNRWRTSTKPGAPYKAEVVYRVAHILDENDLVTVNQVRAALTEPDAQERSVARREWTALPGQRSQLAWGYFLMLCGVPGVKADRMVVRYVARAIGAKTGSKDARQHVIAAAEELGVNTLGLDHAIWRFESGRPVLSEALL